MLNLLSVVRFYLSRTVKYFIFILRFRFNLENNYVTEIKKYNYSIKKYIHQQTFNNYTKLWLYFIFISERFYYKKILSKKGLKEQKLKIELLNRNSIDQQLQQITEEIQMKRIK